MASKSFIFPASFAQQRLWFLEQLEPGKSVYHLLYAVRFETLLDAGALEQSLNEMIRRHESLRTSFLTKDGKPVQIVATEMRIELPVIDLSGLPESEREREGRCWSEREATQPFDLAAGPLLRARLLRFAENESVLLLCLHHIISDGWSMGVLFRELAAFYESFSANQRTTLPDLAVQYADYAVWQRDWLQGEELDTQVSYWKSQLDGAPVLLELATDRPRPPVQTFVGARRYVELSGSLVQQLRTLSNRESVTLFMTLLAAFDVLLWRHSGQDDVIVGTPIAGRNRSELEGVIGLFANTLPLRVDLSGNPRFRELLVRVRETALDAYAHQDIPFDKLVEELHPERTLSHTPVFQVIFAFENASLKQEFPGLNMKWLEVDRGISRGDLSLFITENQDSLSCMWEYSTDLFDKETIERMIVNYQTLLESIVEQPEQRIAYYQTCSDAELRRMLVEWNSAKSPQLSEQCIQEQFEDQVEQTPDAIALVFDNERLTYREVNERANQMAHYLRKRGIRPETPVGVCLGRSAKMIVALLGILKAGGAYVPLDPGYPAERLAFILADARVPLLLTEKTVTPILEGVTAQVISLDECSEIAEESVENPLPEGTPDNLAYVIYTSGSTGLPKGVEVSHRTVVHLFGVTREQLGFVEGDVWTVVHSSAFDFSVWEIWGSLLQGGRLIVVPLEVVQSPPDLYSLLCREQVTVLNQTPAALRQLLLVREQQAGNEDWSVRLIVCGGDALDHELAAELVKLRIPVWNFYGPTESTVWTTCTLIERGPAGDMTSVGRPIADLNVYLLNNNLQPVPMGVPGELFIGGDGLARGYLNRPELTADRFLPDPFSPQPGKRLYRTGDLARYHRQGKLDILGRIDHQVKLRGFRVELGEIEVAISQHVDVAQAVALVREDQPGEKRLVAYVVAESGRPVTANELRSFLQQSLPDYMVPTVFVMLEALPLSRNKKVDRNQLPAPDYAAIQPGKFIAAQDPVEELLAAIWAKLLGLEKVARHDNFFELGGHSLLAMQVISRIREVFQVELPPRALFEMPTIAGLAQKLGAVRQAQEKLQFPRLTPVTRSDRLPLSFAQQRLWFLDQLEPGLPFYNMARAFRLQGPLDTVALSAALSEIVNRHESLRTSFVDDGSQYQRIADAVPLSLDIIDLLPLPETERESKAEELVTEEVRQPFDLSGDTLLRAKLLRLKPDEYVLVFTLHHIAADGWSLGVLFRELTVLYNAFADGKPSPLPLLPIQYGDFAFWQRAWLQGDVLERLLSYWKKQLAGAPMVLKLPDDQSRPPVQSFRGAYDLATIPAELTGSLKELSLREGVTLFMTCLAAFQLLISRYTGHEDLVVGTDVANRDRVETEDLIGFFTNLLPLRATLSPEFKFTELLRQAKETTLEAYAHQDLPFEKLVEELSPPRDLGRNPLVQVLLVMQNQPNWQINLHKLSVSRFNLPIESSRFDLVLFLSESDNGLEGLWLYNPDLFDAHTITRLSSNYQKLLEGIVRDPTARLDSFELLTDQAKNKIVEKKDLQESRLNRLRSVRRKSVDLSQVGDVRTGTLEPGQTLPLVIEPASGDIDLAEWATSNKEIVEQYLLQHGAILFRGFAVGSVSEFERTASAIFPELFGEYGDLPREEMGGKVYGSTPYPADETILFHNESSHMHRWPMLIWFYCVKAADQGGESPIVDCRQLYQSMDPAIREPFEQKGLMYVRNFTDGLDVSWQEFFRTNDKSTVEQYCRQNSIAWEWKGDNGLRTRQICPAVVRHPQTSELVFFNQVQLHHISCLAPAVRESLLSMMEEDDLPRNVYYGDGLPIDNSVMEYLVELSRNKCVSFPWQAQDVLMLNNMLVAHSRNPFVGERKIVVAMANLISNEQVEQPNSAGSLYS